MKIKITNSFVPELPVGLICYMEKYVHDQPINLFDADRNLITSFAGDYEFTFGWRLGWIEAPGADEWRIEFTINDL